jgi:hypothetical protein
MGQPFAALVARLGSDVDDVLAISVDALVDDNPGELDDVRQVDELAVLGLALLDPPAISAPVSEMVYLPALALKADVVLVLRAHRVGGLQVVVHRVDRLER